MGQVSYKRKKRLQWFIWVVSLKTIGKPGVSHVLRNSLERIFAEVNRIDRKYKAVDTRIIPFWDGLPL